MSGVGKAWRVIGVALTLTLFWLTFLSYLADDALLMAVSGFGGVLVFLMSWSVAAWFDVHQKDVR